MLFEVSELTIPFWDGSDGLTPWNKIRTMFCIRSNKGEQAMFRVFVEEAAALASITLFVGMIAIWAQVIPQL